MVQEIESVEQFEELVTKLGEWNYNGESKTILDFYSPTCMPCKMMLPILEELEYTTYKIDCMKFPEIASAFGVQGVPQFIFIKDKDVEPESHIGAIPKTSIVEIMEGENE